MLSHPKYIWEINGLDWYLCSFGIFRTSVQGLLTFKASIENSSTISVSLTLYVIFLPFNIHSLLYVFPILFIFCCKKFLLWYCLFGVLFLASWWASLSLDLEFFIIEICMYFLCFWHRFLFFCLYWLFLGLVFMLSQTPQMFCVTILFIHLNFSLTDLSISFT